MRGMGGLLVGHGALGGGSGGVVGHLDPGALRSLRRQGELCKSHRHEAGPGCAVPVCQWAAAAAAVRRGRGVLGDGVGEGPRGGEGRGGVGAAGVGGGARLRRRTGRRSGETAMFRREIGAGPAPSPQIKIGVRNGQMP